MLHVSANLVPLLALCVKQGYAEDEACASLLLASILGVPVVLANKCGPWQSPTPGPPLGNNAGSRFPGLSTIVDSDGSIKAQLGDEEGVIVADVLADPARKKYPVPPRYGRVAYPGPPQRVILRLIEGMGGLSYLFSATRKRWARSISLAG